MMFERRLAVLGGLVFVMGMLSALAGERRTVRPPRNLYDTIDLELDEPDEGRRFSDMNWG